MPASAKTKSKTKPAAKATPKTRAKPVPKGKAAGTSAAAAQALKKGDHLFLVDGSGYIFRAYHALPPLTRKSDGLQVNAVLGFCNMLWKLLAEMKDDKPTHLAVVFDKSEKTFRNDMYPDYKAHRPDTPEDLVPQFPLIRAAVRAFEIPCLEQAGFEADDLIATYARLASEAKATTTIVSSDKDLMQLVGNGVTMYDTMKDRRIGREQVIEKFGVGPEKVIEAQALIGDSTDNVPGVPGIGPKTAAELIGQYGDLETLLKHAGDIKQEKRRQNLIDNADKARLSKRLVTLDQHMPLDVPVEELVVHEPDYKHLIAFLKAMEFTSITRRIAEKTAIDASAIEADASLAANAGSLPPPPSQPVMTGLDPAIHEAAPSATGGRMDPRVKPGGDRRSVGKGESVLTPVALADARKHEAHAAKFDRSKYECVRTLERLRQWIAKAHDAGIVAVDTETTSLDAMQAGLCGFSLALAPNEACYVPLGHREGGGEAGGDLFAPEAKLCPDQIAEKDALALLRPLLEDEAVLKIAQNLKYDWLVFAQRGIEMESCDDTMLISYVLDAGKGGHGMDELAKRWLNHDTIHFKDVAGSGKNQVSFDCVAIDKATEYAAEDADVTLRLWYALKARLAAERVTTVYETLERPMPAVLARMERRGISIDRQVLKRLSGDFQQEQAALEDEIQKLAGEPLNPGSPKQIGDILFGKMNLKLDGDKTPAKTKTGQWSTSARDLEKLTEQGHELPRKILDWRQVSKLRSTYTEALPTYVNPTTNRVHTSYALASTSTGRLSSSEPNLQNIPVRTEDGRKIRKAFIAAPGMKLVSADYSQIELRLLAEVADIGALKKAFQDGVDIHAMTASEMFDVPLDKMTPDVRRRAKAINFGIIYGISAFGLAAQLGIDRNEAGAYIKKYFERFPGIRAYMDETRDFCREHGYVLTLFGRKCHYPEIKNSNPSIRAFNERAAINARLQGSAADIIRRAMIHMEAELAKARLKAQMLLQVHDELIFEVPEAEVAKTLPVVTRVMEKAPEPALMLSVPLQVEARAAGNWDEAH